MPRINMGTARSLGGRTPIVTAAIISLTMGGLQTWEGMETRAYWDKLGSVWTVCLGETRGVKRGDTYTEAQCVAMAEAGLAEFITGLDRCIEPLDRAPVKVQAAVLHWAWNAGIGAACTSTLAKHLRAGDLRAACEQLPRWKFAGGKIVQGLINRRIWERALCLSGL